VRFASRAPIPQGFRMGMMITRRIGLVAMVILLTTGIATAQTTGEPPLQVGDRIRIKTLASSSAIKGRLVAADAAALTLAPEGRDTSHRKFARSEIDQLEVVRGKRSRWLPGALVGAAAAGVGAILMCNGIGCSTGEGDDTAKNVAVAAGIGAATGALVGLLIKTDRWKTVPADSLNVTVGPVPGHGLALTVRLSF